MSVNEKMTALADEIRELSGTTTAKSIDAMTTDVNAANTEINDQTNLIAQIYAALEDKAGGGSSNIETCTVDIRHYPTYDVNQAIDQVVYQTLDENGNIIVKELSSSNGTIDYTVDTFSLANVVCPSILYIYGGSTSAIINSGGTLLLKSSYGYHVFQIDENADLQIIPQA